MQIKTMRYHFTPVRMTVIKKTGDNRCWWGYSKKKKEILYTFGRNVNCFNHYGKWYECSTNLINLPYDPAIPLLGIYPKEMKTWFQRYACTPVFIAALFTVTKRWKCKFHNQWMDKKTMLCIYTMELYSGIRKEDRLKNK